jgi:hypothetical protein
LKSPLRLPLNGFHRGGSFAGCSALTSFTVSPEGCPAFKSGTGSLYTTSGQTLIAYPGGLGGHVNIPSSVTTIGASAFRYNDTLTGVTFSNSIVNGERELHSRTAAS